MIINLYDEPFAVSKPKVFEYNNIGEWLLDYYGESPQVNVQVFKGDICAENEITANLDALVNCKESEVNVLETPGAEITLASILVNILISVAIAVVAKLLAPTPTLPSNVNRDQQSPNNSLGSRENQVRVSQRVEDIYGTVKSIPSLMMPTYIKYKNNSKFEYGYYCIGRGYYDIQTIKDADTPIATIPGAAASVYAPFTSPNSGDAPQLQIGAAITDDVVTVRRSVEVDGITLKALNQVQLPDSAIYTFTPNVSGDIITQSSKNPNFASCVSVGDNIIVSGATGATSNNNQTPSVRAITVIASEGSFNDPDGLIFVGISVGDTFTSAGFVNTANNGTFVVATKPSANKITIVSGTLVDEITSTAVSFSVSRTYNGTYVVYSVSDANISLTTSTFPSTITTAANLKISNSYVYVDPITGISETILTPTEYTNWITMPSLDRDRVWLNIVAGQGMYKDDGGKSVASVDFEISVQQLDPTTLIPTSTVEIFTGSLTGSVSNERAITVEHTTAWFGPARVRIRRTTPYDYEFKGTVVDEIKWADLYSVSPVTKTEFGNKTTVQTVTEATPRATAVKQRQLNCIASRKLPIFNGTSYSGSFDSSGRLVSGTIAATSKLKDIIPAVSVDPKIGQRNLVTDVDMAQIYSVQQELDAWSSSAGQFNYTFDSDSISFEETLTIIANAAFCTAYRQNGKIRLAFDKKQDTSVALFTHRNKKPSGETITRRFANESDYDGVEFIYQDPTTFQSETITLPLSGNYTRLKKFEIPGIRSFPQAWYRANREYQKILGQRVSIETETTMDARSLLPNSRISIVDNTRFKSYDGEVIAQNGLELTLSQIVEFSPDESHSIVLMKRDGSLQSINVTPGSDNKKVILQNLPSESIKTTSDEEGIRTIFSFASDSSKQAMAYLVQEIDVSENQYVKVNAINYSDEYYKYDTLPVPDRNSIIN